MNKSEHVGGGGSLYSEVQVKHGEGEGIMRNGHIETLAPVDGQIGLKR